MGSVEEEIERCVREERTELDLSFIPLACLPESVGGLVSITTVRLYCNELRSIPDGICCLTNLTILDLGNNYGIPYLPVLPETISLFHTLLQSPIQSRVY